MPDPRPKLASNWTLAGLLLFTLTIRAAVLWSLRDNLQQDPDAYREIAENLLRHGEFAIGKGESATEIRPTAYRPPLYPVLLSNLPAAGGQRLSLAKVDVIHLLLGVATVWLTWLTARRMLSRRVRETHHESSEETVRFTHPTVAPLLAGFLVACDPILLNQQTLVMTETLAAFLAVLSLWCLARFDGSHSWFNAALAGGAIGLAILCRPTFLPWLGLVGAVMLVVRGRNSEFRIQNSELKVARTAPLAGLGWHVANLLAFGIGACTVMSPWVIRNYQVFHKPIATTTHGGYTLYLANNESFYEYLAKGNFDLPWDAASLKPHVFSKDRPLTEDSVKILEVLYAVMAAFEKEKLARGYTNHQELLKDRVSYALAKKCIREHPSEFLSSCVYRLRQFWSPLPYKLTADESSGRRLLRYATCAWYCGVYTLAVVGIWRLRWKLLSPPWIWGVLLCLAFTTVHTFYWTNLRMRAPLMPFVAIVAAAAIVRNGTRSVPATSRQSAFSSAATSSYSPHPPS